MQQIPLDLSVATDGTPLPSKNSLARARVQIFEKAINSTLTPEQKESWKGWNWCRDVA